MPRFCAQIRKLIWGAGQTWFGSQLCGGWCLSEGLSFSSVEWEHECRGLNVDCKRFITKHLVSSLALDKHV